MQRKVNRFFNRPMPTATQERRNQLNWGLIGFALGGVILLVAGYLYFFQPGKAEYRANFTEAQALQTGVDVRVAGISIGQVTGLALKSDHVEVTFKVDRDVFIGNASTISMKMLTTVGGYYLAINPLGDRPLGDTPIPADRVTMPYSLMETFQEATPKVRKLQTVPVRESMALLEDALKDQPDSIRNTVGAVNKMMDNALRQQQQIGDFVKLLGEYSQNIRDNGDLLVSLMNNMSTFFAAAEVNLGGFKAYLTNTTELVQRLVPLLNVYMNEIDPLASRFDAVVAKAKQLIAQAEPTIEQGKQMIKNLQATIAPDGTFELDQSRQQFLASNVCIPTPGVNC
jgi:phospholipid/cholesterol/gamma-HCH transport system substrate-binding protein